MPENESFKIFLNEFDEIIYQLNSAEYQTLLILGQMPDSCDVNATSISKVFGKINMKLTEVVEMIRRLRDRDFSSG